MSLAFGARSTGHTAVGMCLAVYTNIQHVSAEFASDEPNPGTLSDLPPLRRCYGHAVSQTPRSVAGGQAVATPRPSARQKRYSTREVARGHSAPPAREGRGNTAGGQTTSGSVQEAVMRNAASD